jgi:prephenate dehydratase
MLGVVSPGFDRHNYAALTPISSGLTARPAGEPWSYRFFVEFDHQVGDAAADAVVNDIAGLATEARMLGTYPRWGAGRRGSIGWSSGNVSPV